MKSLRRRYLDSARYHRKHGREKFSVGLRKLNRDDIDMMLPPGIARVLSDVKENSRNIWDYTARSNRVAVISDGSSVMSLGDIGPNAVMPILESSCLLLKKLADIDAVPIALDGVRGKDGRTYAFRVVECVKRFNPGFGAFVIENVSSPAIFETEAQMRKELLMPLIIDDIDGCAVAVLAAVLNSLKLTKRSIEATRFVISGAGGAGLSTASLLVSAGASQENMFLCDTRGVLYRGRAGGMNPYKESFAQRTMARKLDEIVDGADVFIGLSAGKVLRPRLIQRMNPKPIVLALAQPVPEINAEKAIDAGAFIFASGCGFNTVSSLLAYPGILRAVLDTRAKSINDDMRIAAAQAIARITQRQVPQRFRRILSKNYPYERKLGVFKSRRPLRQRYILPKLLDPRLVPAVADAVAESAVGTNAAGLGLIRGYRKKLSARINSD